MNLDLTREEARIILDQRYRTLHAERAAIDAASLILNQTAPAVYEHIRPIFASRHTTINDALTSVTSRLAHLK